MINRVLFSLVRKVRKTKRYRVESVYDLYCSYSEIEYLKRNKIIS